MKLKTTFILTALISGSNAATNIALSNFAGVSAGVPIVDNTGTPISAADASVDIGTFDSAFAATLGGLAVTADSDVIAAFTSAVVDTSSPIGFNPNGLFNNQAEVDGDGSLAGTPLYALITWAPGGGDAQAMVLSFADAATFPTQNATGAASVDLGRLIGSGDVVFGGDIASVNTSTLPAPFQKPEFEMGLGFDSTGVVIPEPSTGILASLAGLALLARRRR